MALVLKNRVLETTSTTGTGTLTLTGTIAGYQTFASAFTNADTLWYTLTDGTIWEVGLGTYNTSTLTRDTVYGSSSSGSKITCNTACTVFCDQPAEQAFVTSHVHTFTAPQRGAYVALTSSGAGHIAVNLALSCNFNHTMTETTVLDAPSNVVAGQSGVIEITQHASAAKLLTYASFWKWAGGTTGTISATLSSKNIITYMTDSGATFATCTLQTAVS